MHEVCFDTVKGKLERKNTEQLIHQVWIVKNEENHKHLKCKNPHVYDKAAYTRRLFAQAVYKLQNVKTKNTYQKKNVSALCLSLSHRHKHNRAKNCYQFRANLIQAWIVKFMWQTIESTSQNCLVQPSQGRPTERASRSISQDWQDINESEEISQ